MSNSLTKKENIKTYNKSLTPREIVKRLDRYIISQDDAKRAVAVAMRNRWRRMNVEERIREDITPKNIIMIGPTGVGKTEIARRLAKLADAPFVKVEASKFTEVGYIGRDVESIIRDLMDASMNLVKEEEALKVESRAKDLAEERILDLLLPGSNEVRFKTEGEDEDNATLETRKKLKKMLQEGKLEDRVVEVEVSKQVGAHLEILGPPGMGEMESQLKDMVTNMLPKSKESRRVSVLEARKLLIKEAQEDLVDLTEVQKIATKRAEQTGIVFIDEIDKICGTDSGHKGPEVSREGVQRDLLPLVEGCTVNTKYGPIKSDHVLFIASGAFHFSKPSDLMPEFQGRFPIRVELKSLTAEHFVRILTEPQNALTKQYKALLETEGVKVEFSDEAIKEIALLTADVNSTTENIGARRLHTLLEKLFEELSFEADKKRGERVIIDKEYVMDKLGDIVKDQDLSRFML